MAKIVWLGEPNGDDEGPRKNVWNGVTFHRGEEVEIDNEYMIRKASKNPHYSVDGVAYVPPGGMAHPNAGPVGNERTQFSEMKVGELRKIATERGVDVEGLSKAEIVEKLSAEEE